MRYVLQDLLNIRELRDDEANQNLLREKNRLDQTLRDLEERKRELEEYIRWRIEKENGIYAALMKQRISSRHLAEVRMQITILREGDLVKQQKILEAEKAVEQAKEAVEKARVARNAALRDLQKIEEHRDLWLEEWNKEQNLLLDRELEELHTHHLEFGDEENEEDEFAVEAA